jgi:membrane associated rhomboid family serine protease
MEYLAWFQHMALPWDKPLNEIVQFVSGAVALLGFVMAAVHRYETENHSMAASALLGGIICGIIWFLSVTGAV